MQLKKPVFIMSKRQRQRDFNNVKVIDLVNVDGASADIGILLGNTRNVTSIPPISFATQSVARSSLIILDTEQSHISTEMGPLGAPLSRLSILLPI